MGKYLPLLPKKMRSQVKLRFVLVWLVIFITVSVLNGGQVLASSQNKDLKKLEIPKEPGWNHPSYRGWESLSITGLIATYYDLDLDRELDYMVIRKVIRKASAEETTIEKAIEIAKFDNLSVFFSHPIVYFTNGNPLFYCKGVDHRGNCRGDMWVDIAEDGLNGNEELNSLSAPSLRVR
jgi:hypothetical protein